MTCKECGDASVHALGMCRKCFDAKRSADREARIAAGDVVVRPGHINIGLKICTVCKKRAASIKGMCSICRKRVAVAARKARNEAEAGR